MVWALAECQCLPMQARQRSSQRQSWATAGNTWHAAMRKIGRCMQDFLQQQWLGYTRTWRQSLERGHAGKTLHAEMGNWASTKDCNGSVQVRSQTTHLDLACTLLSHHVPWPGGSAWLLAAWLCSRSCFLDSRGAVWLLLMRWLASGRPATGHTCITGGRSCSIGHKGAACELWCGVHLNACMS